jgi:lysophospholipid acyltransferase 5
MEAIETPPTVTEWFGYCFFPGTLFVGPAFPFRRYKDFVDGKLFPEGIPLTLLPTLKSMFLGVTCLSIHLGLSGTFSAKYFLTDEYAALAVIKQLVYIYIWIRVYSLRYVSIWLISDSGCIASGIGYNGIGTDPHTPKWNALSNVDLYYLETDVTLNSGPRSFNIQTNIWILKYVYKRLRFLRSKHISMVLSLVFLTVWHGCHAGYFLTFTATELPLLIMEKVTLDYASKYVQVENLSPMSKGILLAIGYIWRWTAIGYAVIPFELKRLDRGLQALEASHFLFHVVFMIWVICVILYMMISCCLKIRKKAENKNDFSHWTRLLHFGETRNSLLCAQQNGEARSPTEDEDRVSGLLTGSLTLPGTKKQM